MSSRLRDYIPALKYGAKIYPDEVVGSGLPLSTGNVIFVDGDKSSGGAGGTWEDAYSSIQTAVTAAIAGDVIMIAERTITALATDPISYAETVIIPNSKPHLSLIGVSRGRTQGGLPQMKIGAGSTAMITVRSPECLIAGIGINGASSTGGGILLDDDGGTSKVAFGTTIAECHFKNCAGATSADTGGGVQWSSNGGAWQVRVQGCNFFRCMGGVVLKGTGISRPVDIVIEDSIFYTNDTALVDCDIYLMGGDGVDGLLIRGCTFASRTIPAYAGTSRYLKLTGCSDGLISDCTFNCLANVTATELTWGTAGTAAFIPAGVGIANCHGVSTTRGETGEICNL
jgi:hypothetical protein